LAHVAATVSIQNLDEVEPRGMLEPVEELNGDESSQRLTLPSDDELVLAQMDPVQDLTKAPPELHRRQMLPHGFNYIKWHNSMSWSAGRRYQPSSCSATSP
jgi:hypothetical protein